MEYSEDFRLIQTTLNNCNESVKNFSEIVTYGGNEAFVAEIAKNLNSLFQQKGYDPENSNELRKITFFLMLNTDISFSRDLNDDKSVCHLLNNFPQLSKCLFVHLVWQLRLERYLYEAIRHAPTWFVLQFLPEIIDSLRFSKRYVLLVQVRDILGAIYYSICRMDYRAMNTEQNVYQKTFLNKIFDIITGLLRNFNPPTENDDISKSKKRLREYLGYSLHNQLKMIHNCFEVYKKKPSLQVSREHKIYKLMIETEPESSNFNFGVYTPLVDESLTKVNVALLNTLQANVIKVTIEDFMEWVEIDIEDPETEDPDLKRDNLQKSIGAMSYELIVIICKREIIEHDVVKQLETISIRPKSLVELAMEATVGTVLQKIDVSPNKRVWLEELLNRPESLYFNTECLQAVIDNIDLITLKDLQKVLVDHQNYGDMDRDDEIQIAQIFRKGGERLNTSETREFVEDLVRTLGGDYSLLTDEEASKHSSKLVNYYNKLTESDIDECTMWRLILVKPARFYDDLTEDISKQDKTQIDVILKILSDTDTVSVEFINKIAIGNLQQAAEAPQSMYHIFLAGIFFRNLIDRREFLRSLMENLVGNMAHDNLYLILMLLKTLREICESLKPEDLLAPLIILLAQILDKYRWSLATYGQMRESIVEVSIEIIQILQKTILIRGCKRDRDWVTSKIIECSPLTSFYLQKLSLEKNVPIKPLDRFLQPEGFEVLPEKEITAFLCSHLIRCTSKEVKWLLVNETLQKFITDALKIVVMIVSGTNQQLSVLNSLNKCVTDYLKVLQNKIIPSIKDTEEKLTLFMKIIDLIKKFPPASYDDLTIKFIEVIRKFRDVKHFSSTVHDELLDCELKKILSEESLNRYMDHSGDQ